MDERILCESPLVRVTAYERLEPCERLPVYAFRAEQQPGARPRARRGEEPPPWVERGDDAPG